MRKFSISIRPPAPDLVVQEYNDGQVTEIGTVPSLNKYLCVANLTAKELSSVYMINELLRSKDLDELGPEEAAWMFDPMEERRYRKERGYTPEELQKLSGFVVEKTVKSYDPKSK